MPGYTSGTGVTPYYVNGKNGNNANAGTESVGQSGDVGESDGGGPPPSSAWQMFPERLLSWPSRSRVAPQVRYRKFRPRQ